MKNKSIITLFILTNLLFTCTIQSSEQLSLKESIINELINKSDDLKSPKTSGKIIILKTKFCKNFDCEIYFQDFKEQFQFYSREDAFLRAISDYLEIQKIDEEKGQISFTKRTKGEYQTIEIN